MISPPTFNRLKKEQAELDHFFYSQSNIQFEWVSFWNAKRLKLSLFTEVAEFANELRTFKIWPQKEPINQDKVKEELIDCGCFFLGLVNLYQIDLSPTNFLSLVQTEPNDLLLDFFAKTDHLALIENPQLYPQQLKFTPVQLETYQVWWKVFQQCLHQIGIKNDEELLSVYLTKKKINLGRKK